MILVSHPLTAVEALALLTLVLGPDIFGSVGSTIALLASAPVATVNHSLVKMFRRVSPIPRSAFLQMFGSVHPHGGNTLLTMAHVIIAATVPALFKMGQVVSATRGYDDFGMLGTASTFVLFEAFLAPARKTILASLARIEVLSIGWK